MENGEMRVTVQRYVICGDTILSLHAWCLRKRVSRRMVLNRWVKLFPDIEMLTELRAKTLLKRIEQ
jgi:hypothetical protein